ncbi:MAG TPA: hypothetical protein DCM05_17210 [Elusimicrobia bacterium]|nr:hypothetical protein [Elusimicrobiota bacterium]
MSRSKLAVWLVGASAWLALLGPLGRDNYACDDLWGKLSIPAVWLSTGRFPYVDRFSYTAWGERWIDHEWLAGVVFYGSLQLGDLGLSLLKALMVALLAAGVVWSARLKRLSPLWPAGILLLGLPHLFNGLVSTGRPQLFTFCLLPGLLAFLEWTRQEGRHRALWLVLPVGVVWANLHGGFVAGLGMVLCYALGEALRGKAWLPYLLAAGAWAAGTALNPYGFEYWRYLAYALTLPRPEITEWHHVVLWGSEDWSVKLCILAAAAAILLAFDRARRERLSWRELPWPLILALVAAFWQSFRAVKLTPLGVLSAACCVPPLLAWALPGRLEEDEDGWTLAVLGFAGALVWTVGNWVDMRPRFQPWQVTVRDNGFPKGYRQGAGVYPVEAVEFLEESGGCGNVLTPFNTGEFIYWRLYPRFRVSNDGRLECAYPMDVFRSQLEAGAKGDLESPAVKAADWVLIGRQGKLYDALKASPAWKTAHEDETYTVFRRALSPEPRKTGGSKTAGGWSPVSAFFTRERFRGYASETGSAKEMACGPSGS